MHIRYFLPLALLTCTLSQASDQFRRQIIDGQLFENGELVEEEVVSSESENDTSVPHLSQSAPTVPSNKKTKKKKVHEQLRTTPPLRPTKARVQRNNNQ